MIRWCSYCQRYQGESEPFEDFSLTHTVCEACLASDAVLDDGLPERVEPIRQFFRQVAEAGADPSAAPKLFADGLNLGLPPADLLMGILQPALYLMGERWAESTASVYEEHRLTGICATMIQLACQRQPDFAALRQSASPRVLLVNADGNYHTLGVQVVEFFLLSHGVPVFTVFPGLPAREVQALAESLRPKVIGMSVALPTQLGSVREIGEKLGALPAGVRPKLVAGGFGVRRLEDPGGEYGFSLCKTPGEMLRLVGPHLGP